MNLSGTDLTGVSKHQMDVFCADRFFLGYVMGAMSGDIVSGKEQSGIAISDVRRCSWLYFARIFALQESWPKKIAKIFALVRWREPSLCLVVISLFV